MLRLTSGPIFAAAAAAVVVTQALCLSLGVPEPPNYPLSPRIVVFGT